MTDKNKVHTIYKLLSGERVPSVTTFLYILNKPALVPWAWGLGVEGLDFNKVRDEASRIGTLVHYLILCDLKGEEPDLSGDIPQEVEVAKVPMEKWMEWSSAHKLEPILLEQPLVSEIYKFGGTLSPDRSL